MKVRTRVEKSRAGEACLVIAITVLAGVAGLHALAASAGPREDELARFQRYFERGAGSGVRGIVDEMAWKGVTDVALYDTMADSIREAMYDRDDATVEQTSWLVKALALSGNKKYAPLMNEIIEGDAHKKLKKHTRIARDRLFDYERWLPTLNAGTESAETRQELDRKRITNLLSSGDSELVRVGAKRVYIAHGGDPVLQEAVASVLMKRYERDSSDKVHIDSIAWLCKALAESGSGKYASMLDRVAEDAPNKKVRKQARKYARHLSGS
jgi:hypothetical protein